MFCSKCGAQMIKNARFCAKCGEPSLNTNDNVKTLTTNVNTAAHNSSVVWKLMVAVVVIVAVVLTTFFVLRASPLIATQRALGNFGTELESRLQTSPFYAIELLGNNLQNGTTSVGFTYRDRWSERFDGNVAFMADSRQDMVALTADININGIGADFEFMLNNQHAVARTGLLGNQYYGITFATFRDDFRGFASDLGLDRHTRDAIIDMVESFESTTTSGMTDTDYLAPYQEILASFIRGSSFSSGREDGMTRVEFKFDDEDVIALLWELLDAFEADDNLTGMFDTIDQNEFDQLMRELRQELRDLERNIRGEATLVLYTGSRNRLNRLELSLDIGLYGDWVTMEFILDLGASALDDWRLDAYAVVDGVRDSFSVLWEIEEIGNRFINTVTLSESGDAFMEFGSNWNTGTGVFTLSYKEFGMWGNQGDIGGTFRVDDGGFRLAMDEITSGGQRLLLEIESLPTVDIQFPSRFTNISDWSFDQLRRDLEQSFQRWLWGW